MHLISVVDRSQKEKYFLFSALFCSHVSISISAMLSWPLISTLLLNHITLLTSGVAGVWLNEVANNRVQSPDRILTNTLISFLLHTSWSHYAIHLTRFYSFKKISLFILLIFANQWAFLCHPCNIFNLSGFSERKN